MDEQQTKNKQDDPEDIEGNDDYFYHAGWGQYPLSSVFIRSETRTVREVLNRIEKGRYVMDPDFQRGFVWLDDKQSKLIESCIMRIPLPVFYVAELEGGEITIVDGLQRLTTFQRFINNKFKLKFPVDKMNETEHPLAGLKFEDLKIGFQERIEDTQLTFYILDSKAPDRAKLDIFDRVNSGVPLSRQQMRNALYNGPATQWLKSVVESKAFKTATSGSLSSKTMRDREAANRFVSFKLCGWKKYKGDMDGFLAEGLKRLTKLKESERTELENSFLETMSFCYDVFGKHTFRRSISSDGEKRSVINIALFDVMSVHISNNIDEFMEMNKKEFKNYIKELLDDEDFITSIRYSTNDTKSVRFRHESFEEFFEL